MSNKNTTLIGAVSLFIGLMVMKIIKPTLSIGDIITALVIALASFGIIMYFLKTRS